ncbi:MAG: PfkB family carbohydrate kinase [Devosiaceae bacterium]|nr:PfkB family carbohydrate kinase [Devosiaceae bacterium]
MSTSDSSVKTVLLVGDVMRDVIVRPQGVLREGSDCKAKIEMRPGGSGANQAVWLAANGVSARLVARVGASDLAALSAQFLERGVEPLFAGDTELATGTLISMIDPGGERSFYTDRGANEVLSIEDLGAHVLDDVSMVVLSGYSFFIASPREVAKEVMVRAGQKNIPVLIDPSSSGFIRDVGVARFLDWTRGAAILFPNAQEAELLSGESDPETQLRVLRPYFDRVVITQGALGAVTLDEHENLLFAPGENVAALDTTGAGDAFLGGFVAAQLAGQSLYDSLCAGNKQGARAVGHIGGQP